MSGVRVCGVPYILTRRCQAALEIVGQHHTFMLALLALLALLAHLALPRVLVLKTVVLLMTTDHHVCKDLSQTGAFNEGRLPALSTVIRTELGACRR